jgi:phosphatidylserine synthase
MTDAGKDLGAWAAGARLVLAVCAAASLPHLPNWAGAAAMVAGVWFDALAGVWLRRRGAPKTRTKEAVELLADFGGFAVLPALWIASLNPGKPWVLAACAVHVLAAASRLARFHREGLVSGSYRGLPTTYCGYVVPVWAGAIHLLSLPPSATWWAGVLAMAWAMNSRRIRVPEF